MITTTTQASASRGRWCTRSFLLLTVVLEGCSLDWSVTPDDSTVAAGDISRKLVGDASMSTEAPSVGLGLTDSDRGFDAATDAGAHATTNADADTGASCRTPNCGCDGDGDGFYDLTKPGCADAGGPNDCDDTDSRVRPGQSYLDVSSPPRGGDLNCANGVEKL